MKLIFCVFLILLSSAFAKTKIAKIKTNMAVIYKDPSLKVPLGYMRRGKNLQVSTFESHEKNIMKLVINGKIAYIHKKNIDILSVDQLGIRKIREHNTKVIGLDQISINAQKTSVTLTYSSGQSGADWATLSKHIGDKNSGSLKTFAANIIYAPPENRFFFGVGLKKLSIDQTSLRMSSLYGSANLYAKVFRYKDLLVMFNSEVLATGDFQVDTAYSETPSRGISYGINLGLNIRFFPESKWGTLIGFNMQKLKVLELEPMNNADGDEYFLTELSGATLHAGVSYHF